MSACLPNVCLSAALCVAGVLALSPSSTASAQSANYPGIAPAKKLRVSYPQAGAAGNAADARETVTAGPLDDLGGGANFSTRAIEQSDVMLQKEIDSLDAERTILKVQLGDSHPSVQVFDARIAAAEKALANVRRRNAGAKDASDESLPAASAAITDAETQASIEQLQRVVRVLAERLLALEAEVAKLKQQ